MNKIIGLTGGIGTGKSTTAKLWSEFVPFIDADDIIIDLFKDQKCYVYQELVKYFSKDIVKNEVIDRDLLRIPLQANTSAREKADEIVVPAVWKKVIEFQENNLQSAYILFVSARLMEAKFPVDKKVVIDTPDEIRIKRAIDRGTSEQIVKKIIQGQIPAQDKIAMADFILVNSGTLDDLKNNVKTLHQIISEQFIKKLKISV